MISRDYKVNSWAENFCPMCGQALWWIDTPLFSRCENRDCIECPDYSPFEEDIDLNDWPME